MLDSSQRCLLANCWLSVNNIKEKFFNLNIFSFYYIVICNLKGTIIHLSKLSIFIYLIIFKLG